MAVGNQYGPFVFLHAIKSYFEQYRYSLLIRIKRIQRIIGVKSDLKSGTNVIGEMSNVQSAETPRIRASVYTRRQWRVQHFQTSGEGRGGNLSLSSYW